MGGSATFGSVTEQSTLGDALAARRRHAFVGRASERELFEAALVEPTDSFSVLWLFGPGGIGKSSLLDVLAESAATSGATVVRVGPDELAAEDTAASIGIAGEGGAQFVYLVDDFERLAAVEDWFRTTWLPSLPGSALTVVAGRDPPSAAWRGDVAWRDLLRIVSLRNLEPGDARRYLSRCGVDEAAHDLLVETSSGHPLALSLLADLTLRDEEGVPTDRVALWTPDIVSELVRRLVRSVPSDRHRQALEVCALARTTTEDLLRDALETDDAGELFEWLAEQSFVRLSDRGLWPHDLARDVIDAELRWRDPSTYRTVFHRVRAHVHRRLHSLGGIDQQRAIADEKFVFRNLPTVLSPVEWSTWGSSYPAPARPDERAVLLGLVERYEGAASAAIAGRWWDLQPGAFHVVRDAGGAVRGLLAMIRIDGRSADELAFDPGALAAVEFASRTDPLREGEAMTQLRFVVDAEWYQAPSPTVNAAPILSLQHILQTPSQAWDVLALFEPEPLDDYFAICDMPRVDGGDFEVGGRRYGLFAHDFRRVPVDAWLETITDRALALDPVVRPAPQAEVVVLSHAAFSDAARQALRDLHRPDCLDRNPLARARLVTADGSGKPRGAGRVLAEKVRTAVAQLEADPRDHKRWRALDRTYLRPAPSQERAAELLGLPFSTYRRHLTEGVDRVVAQLWDLELGTS
jgi:hypothetical protein